MDGWRRQDPADSAGISTKFPWSHGDENKCCGTPDGMEKITWDSHGNGITHAYYGNEDTFYCNSAPPAAITEKSVTSFKWHSPNRAVA